MVWRKVRMMSAWGKVRMVAFRIMMEECQNGDVRMEEIWMSPRRKVRMQVVGIS